MAVLKHSNEEPSYIIYGIATINKVGESYDIAVQLIT